jgi:hypothetical protein
MKFVYRGVIGLPWITASFRKPRSHILNRGTLPSPNSQSAWDARRTLDHLFHKLIHLN